MPTLAYTQRVRRAAGFAAGGLALVALLYAKGVPCFFATVLHAPCPGCGSTRAVICLLHGDIAGVVHNNPIGPVAAVLLGALGLQAFASIVAHGDLRELGKGRVGRVLVALLFAAAAVEIVVWVARFFGALGGPVSV